MRPWQNDRHFANYIILTFISSNDDHILVWISLKYLPTVPINTLRPRQNGRHFPDDIFKWIFLNENLWISINISLKFVPRGPINNISTLVKVMAWRRPDDKPLSEPMMVRLPTHICVTRPQWVNNMSTFFQITSWRRTGRQANILTMQWWPSSLNRICVARSRWFEIEHKGYVPAHLIL